MNARGHFALAFIVWAVLSGAGIALLVGVHAFPQIASREAIIVDGAFVILTMLSVPVLMLVVVTLVYSAVRFRVPATDQSDASPIRRHRIFEAGWLLVTLGLVIVLAAYGTVGLLEIRGASDAGLEVKAMATQWKWSYEYPSLGIESKELVLPVGQRIRILIVSDDVIHSFYVPAFGVKHDAVPGRTSVLYVTTTVTGEYGAQCAELCGLGHTRMTSPVRVVEPAEFEAWATAQQAATGGG